MTWLHWAAVLAAITLSTGCMLPVDNSPKEQAHPTSEPEANCRQYTADVASFCPSAQFFVIICETAVPDPGGVECTPGLLAPHDDPNTIWCCR